MSEPQEPRRSDDPEAPEPATNLWTNASPSPPAAPSFPAAAPAAPYEPPAPSYPAPSYEAPYSSPPGYPVDPYSQPISGPPPLPVPYPPAPASYPAPYQLYPGEHAAFGFDPVTGLPYSEKTKVIAGLLQLLPTIVFSLGGIGRLYAGNTTLGVVQIVASVVGWTAFWCGFVLVVPFVLYGGIWLWFVIDAIMIFAGRPVDGQGRPLRS